MKLPEDHPLRSRLNDEVHARPPEELVAPVRMSFLGLVTDWLQSREDLDPLRELAERFERPPPPDDARHYSQDFGPFRLRWERHSEFTRYMVIVPAGQDGPFSVPAIRNLPDGWVENLPGRLIVATHIELRADAGDDDLQALSKSVFADNVVVGARVSGGDAAAFTDFRIRDDSFSRLLVVDHGLTPRQGGRLVQRLLEIDTYRMMALLALPVAQELGPSLTRHEQELAEITSAMTKIGEADEPALLDRLTQLAASVESRYSDNNFRLSAAKAYYDIVTQRIHELRESRIRGLQTFQEFTERRLAPAMNTCLAVAERQQALSERVAQATRLLSTRVDLTAELQNKALLESMNRRAALQLRLQQTVEGLSVAAISYYIVSLLGYAANVLPALGIEVSPKVVMAASIPFVLAFALLGVRRIRRHFTPGRS